MTVDGIDINLGRLSEKPEGEDIQSELTFNEGILKELNRIERKLDQLLTARRGGIMELWDAFLEDYRDRISDWPLRKILKVFWYYCQDGVKSVNELFEREICKKIIERERK